MPWVAAGIPFGPVAQVADASGPRPRSRPARLLVEIEHPSLGGLLVTGLPVKLSATPGGGPQGAARMVGEDNDRVYREVLGLDASERSPSSEPPGRSDRRTRGGRRPAPAPAAACGRCQIARKEAGPTFV